MFRAITFVAGICVLLAAGADTMSRPDEHSIDRSDAAENRRQQGKYLVHHVAKCIECHTPRDENGRLMRHLLLQGAPMPVESPFPNQQWAFRAPKIAGLPGWEERQIVVLLQTGRRPSGLAPRPPMPAFGMTEEDARAVVAYLKSLE